MILLHRFKCPYCEQYFDADKEEWVQVNTRRKAHKACAEKEKEHRLTTQSTRDALLDYINELYKKNNINPNWPMIQKQIKKYVEGNKWTYSGIKRTLIYCYEVKKIDIRNCEGDIRAVTIYYPEAYKYYEKIFITNKKNEQIASSYKNVIQEVKIKSQKPNRKIKLFDIGD